MAERKRPPRVLVIDDASLVRMYYREALEAGGFEVEVAFNGLEGLEKVGESSFDLLVVDVNMPRMDGLTFVRTLRRAEPAVATVPVLVSSTESAEQDKQAARAAGANYYLVKPVRPDVLLRCATALTGGRA